MPSREAAGTHLEHNWDGPEVGTIEYGGQNQMERASLLVAEEYAPREMAWVLALERSPTTPADGWTIRSTAALQNRSSDSVFQAGMRMRSLKGTGMHLAGQSTNLDRMSTDEESQGTEGA